MFGGFGNDQIQLSQPVTASAGQQFFFQAYLDLENTDPNTDVYCGITFSTDSDTVWTYGYSMVSFTGNISGSGILDNGVSIFQMYAFCYGDYDITVAVDNVAFSIFPSVAGTNPIIPQPVQILQNNNFDSTLDPWVVDTTSGRADVYVQSGQAVVRYNRIHPTYSAPMWVSQRGLFIQHRQTWRVQADVYFTVPSGTNCLAQFVSGQQMWIAQNIVSNQNFHVDVTGVQPSDATEFSMYSTCTGSQVAQVAYDNVYLTLNV
jgi:hypothetical protein